MPLEMARKLLPPSMILGVSVSSVAEAAATSTAGVDYVGIGPIWWTTSKQLNSGVIGPRGISPILDVLSPSIKTVGIGRRSLLYPLENGCAECAPGGIKRRNLMRTLHAGVTSSGRALDGVAVISEIVSSTEPKAAAETLRGLLRTFMDRPHPTQLFPPWNMSLANLPADADFPQRSAQLIAKTRSLTPLVHQITNYVAMTQSANVTLAIGASPIMATAPAEMEDLSKVTAGLLVNFGTIDDFQGMLLAGLSLWPVYKSYLMSSL